jgi:hypothetical protein
MYLEILFITNTILATYIAYKVSTSNSIDMFEDVSKKN